MAALHLWRSSGDPELAERARALARAVLDTAQRDELGVRWPILHTVGEDREPVAHYGFALGVAGTGALLLACGQAFGDEESIRMAMACGRMLDRAAIIRSGAAWWPIDDHDNGPPAGYWCSGSSGVGTFLVRLWSHSQGPRFLELAELAAAAVHRERWAYSPVVCHGLAGNGDFLLDMADMTGDDQCREWARDLAACIAIRTALRRNHSGATW